MTAPRALSIPSRGLAVGHARPRSEPRRASAGRALGLCALATFALGDLGCGAASQAIERPAGLYYGGSSSLFAFRDPAGDDKGPGTYQYPLSFDGRVGVFDITSFEASRSGRDLVLRIGFRRPIERFRDDTSSEAKGWFRQLVDVYIDMDPSPGKGITRTLTGRNVEFDPDSTWEKMVLITPNRSEQVERLIENRTEDLGLVKIRKSIIIPRQVTAEGYDLVARVPLSELGAEPQASWGYQAMVMPFDENALEAGRLQNGRVRRFPSQDEFGGGSDGNGDPNVIDILASSADEQYRQLGDYVSSPSSFDNRYARLRHVYGAPASAPLIPRASSPPPARRSPSEGALAPGTARPASSASAAPPPLRADPDPAPFLPYPVTAAGRSGQPPAWNGSPSTVLVPLPGIDEDALFGSDAGWRSGLPGLPARPEAHLAR